MKTINYYGFEITQKNNSHCATIWRDGDVFKMITGNGKRRVVKRKGKTGKGFLDVVSKIADNGLNLALDNTGKMLDYQLGRGKRRGRKAKVGNGITLPGMKAGI